MQFFKGLLILSIFRTFLSCESEEKQSENTIGGIEILKSELVSYPLNDTLTVNGVDAEFINHGESAEFYYIVSLFQGEKTWVDSTAFIAAHEETARLQFIFGESIVSKSSPASFSAKLVAIQDTTDVR